VFQRGSGLSSGRRTGPSRPGSLAPGSTPVTSTGSPASTKETGFEFDDYAASGQHYINIFADWALPGITRASMSMFEDRPAGGTAYGSIANTRSPT
jgi:hypothetical protein